MKKLVCSALALSLTSAAGYASDDDWSTLDEEVEALTSSLSVQGGGPTLFGRVRILYTFNGDIPGVAPPALPGTLNDTGGFTVPDARLGVKGAVGDYEYFVQVNLSALNQGLQPTIPALLDAYVDLPVGGSVNSRIGLFKSPVLRSALIDSGTMLFVDRTIPASAWAVPGSVNTTTVRDAGAELFGEFDKLGWWLAVQNGSDGTGDDLMFSLRGGFDFLGDGIGDGHVNGAYEGPESPSGSAYVAYFDDGNTTDGSGFALEAYLATNVYSAGFDLVAYDGTVIPASGGFNGGVLTGGAFTPDSTPWSVQGSWAITPDVWEVGARYGQADDVLDTQKIDLSVNRYLQGHDLKWTLQYSNIGQDTGGVDQDMIMIQLQAGF